MSPSWAIRQDLAWMRISDRIYLHHSGAVLVTSDSGGWAPISTFGMRFKECKTASAAITTLEKRDNGFRLLYALRECRGAAVFSACVVVGDAADGHFAVAYTKGVDHPQFLAGYIARRSEGKALCLACSAPLQIASLETKESRYFDGELKEVKTFLVCSCGGALWGMERRSFWRFASDVHARLRGWERQRLLKEAGGSHREDEVEFLLALQGAECLYCSKKFDSATRPSKDHVLPVLYGGSNSIYNIVLTCRSCNSSRGDIPFRTYCSILTPAQNKKILAFLRRRVLATNFKTLEVADFAEWELGLALHEPQHTRYLLIKRGAAVQRNVRKNKLLPRTLHRLIETAPMRTLHTLKTELSVVTSREGPRSPGW